MSGSKTSLSESHWWINVFPTLGICFLDLLLLVVSVGSSWLRQLQWMSRLHARLRVPEFVIERCRCHAGNEYGL